MSYHSFLDEDGNEHGSFEVFYMDEGDCEEHNDQLCTEFWDDYTNGDESEEDYDEIREDILECEGGLRPGWYWWACFPGCLPDGDPCGPFVSEEEAHDDAQS